MEPQETPTENTEQQAPASPTTNQSMNIAAAIITSAAMIAIVLLIVLHSRSTAATPTAGNTAQTTTQQPTIAPDITKVSTSGEPYIGSATAPVTIAYWFDYQCPFCKQDEQTVLPEIIQNYVNAGKVKIVFKDFAFLGPDSTTLGEYARAVWAVDPANFYKWHKAMFDNQGEENTGWATQDKIMSVTTSALGANEAAQVAKLVATNGTVYEQSMAADKAEAENFGIEGTPAALIGTQVITGAEPYANFQQVIDAQLKNK